MGIKKTVMKFGKYHGQPLDEIPGGYLKWLLTQADVTDEILLSEVEDELVRRGEEL